MKIASLFPNSLRTVFLLNALFSFCSALIMLSSSRPLARLMGINNSDSFLFVGLNLLVFAAFLVWLAYREPIPHLLAWAVVASDLVWVIGSFAGLALVPHSLTAIGIFLVIDVAAIVGCFAGLQVRCLLHRLQTT